MEMEDIQAVRLKGHIAFRYLQEVTAIHRPSHGELWTGLLTMGKPKSVLRFLILIELTHGLLTSCPIPYHVRAGVFEHREIRCSRIGHCGLSTRQRPFSL